MEYTREQIKHILDTGIKQSEIQEQIDLKLRIDETQQQRMGSSALMAIAMMMYNDRIHNKQ